MKTVELTQGQVALVDDEDFAGVSRFKWHAMKMGKSFYAGRKVPGGPNKQITVYMHHAILHNPSGDVDHVDGNGLNNTRSNLRKATRKQNAGNQKIAINNTSGIKGVTFHSRDLVWCAQIRVNGKLMHLGNFRSRDKAHSAYKEAAIRYFGEFAKF